MLAKKWEIIILAIIVFLVFLNGQVFAKKPTPTPTPTPTPEISITPTFTPTPTPTMAPNPIPHGTKNFSVSFFSGSKDPSIKNGTIDPYDPDLNTTQTISVNTTSSQPITLFTMTIITDNGSQTIPLNLVSGTDTNGTWSGDWQVNDTYLYHYHLVLDASNDVSSSHVDITLR